MKNLQTKTKKLIIFSTHNIDHAKEICDRVIILKKGRINADLSKEKLKTENLEMFF